MASRTQLTVRKEHREGTSDPQMTSADIQGSGTLTHPKTQTIQAGGGTIHAVQQFPAFTETLQCRPFLRVKLENLTLDRDPRRVPEGSCQ